MEARTLEVTLVYARPRVRGRPLRRRPERFSRRLETQSRCGTRTADQEGAHFPRVLLVGSPGGPGPKPGSPSHPPARTRRVVVREPRVSHAWLCHLRKCSPSARWRLAYLGFRLSADTAFAYVRGLSRCPQRSQCPGGSVPKGVSARATRLSRGSWVQSQGAQAREPGLV